MLVGVVRFPAPDGSSVSTVLRAVLATAMFAVVFLGEEVGWRGFLLLRLAELTSGRRAAVLTGALHAVFHLPLLLLTTTYQSAGSRWIVVPMVMVTLTMAGVWYGWLRLWSGSIWPVSLSHSAFNNVVESVGRRRRRHLPGDDGLRHHRDRRRHPGHRVPGRGLPVGPPGRRLREGPSARVVRDEVAEIRPRMSHSVTDYPGRGGQSIGRSSSA